MLVLSLQSLRFEKGTRYTQLGMVSTIRFEWGTGTSNFGKILVLEASHRLSYTWEALSPSVTTITFELTAKNGGTRLHLTHTGIGEGEDWDRYYTSRNSGWSIHLKNLTAWLARNRQREDLVVETPTQTTLVLAAQAGDQIAFETLVGPYRRELLVHCYRMLGSVHDAEDLVQETLLRAWEKRVTLMSLGSYRAWLYRIATNLCLNALTRVPRRSLPPDMHPQSDPTRPALPRREPIWLEPFPDELLADPYTDPEGRALQRERITLAFLVVLQHLTPVQRAILLLREVLEWPAVEVAEWLSLSVPAVNSALQRARRALHQLHKGSEGSTAEPRPQLQDLLDRYMTLWEQADIPGLVALLREDAWFTMPPIPAWFQGRAAIATVLSTRVFTPSRQWYLLQTCANGSPAFGLYRREAEAGVYQLVGLVVLGVVGEQIGSLVAFLEASSLSSFALPPTLASSSRESTINDDLAAPSHSLISQARSIDDASA